MDAPESLGAALRASGGGRFARRSARSALCALAAASALGVGSCLAISGCAKPAPKAAPTPVVYPYSSAAPRVFYATASGLVEEAPVTADDTHSAARPASRSPNASVLSSDGRAITVAVNGWGVARIECAPARADGSSAEQGESYRIEGTPLPELFSGLSTGGAWPAKSGILVQLYRDPFNETAPAQGAAKTAGARLIFVGGPSSDGTKALDPIGQMAGPGYELFALLPSGGSWFAELRRDQSERVDLKFLALTDPLIERGTAGNGSGASAVREIHRADFEAALKPRPLADLTGNQGVALRAALASLGNHPWLVRLRSYTGEDSWYLSSGLPEDALSVYAWTDGKTIVALRSDGWMATADSSGAHALSRLSPPSGGASFVALTAASDLVAAAWEVGDFPNLDAAGIVVARYVNSIK